MGDRRRRARPARRRPRGRARLHRRRHHRGRRGARRRRLPPCGHGRSSRRAASRWATSSSSARSTPRRSTSRCSTRTASCVTVTMGSYGVGVSRAVAAIAEGNHDELGLVWPRAVSPADVHVVATGKDEAVAHGRRGARRATLEAQGVQVLLDDRRQASPGVKFKDAELIGVPTIVVVGRGLADGTIELKDRRSGERRDLAGGVGGDGDPRRDRPFVSQPVEAVVFDWGGTLTPWHTVDLPEQWRVFAREVHGIPVESPDVSDADLEEAHRLADRILEAESRGLGPWSCGAHLGRARRHPRRGRGRRRPRPAPPGARGLPRVLGAVHPDRPAGAPALGGAARARHQGRGAVEHDLDPRVPPGHLRARRGARPARRRPVLERDRPREAAPRGVPGDLPRARRHPAAGRLRRRPGVRGRARPAAGRHAGDLDPALRHPGRRSGSRSPRCPTATPTSCSTCSTSSTPGPPRPEPS